MTPLGHGRSLLQNQGIFFEIVFTGSIVGHFRSERANKPPEFGVAIGMDAFRSLKQAIEQAGVRIEQPGHPKVNAEIEAIVLDDGSRVFFG